MLKKIKLTFVLSLLLSFSAFSQKLAKDSTKTSAFFFGGNLGLQFGTYTYIEIAPLAGIHLTPFLDLGIGGNYTYTHNNLSDFTNQIYGGNIFVQAEIYKPIVIHMQGEAINAAWANLAGDISRDWFSALLVGGGIRQYVSPKSYTFLLVLWNLNDGYNSPYNNPVIKVGFVF